MLKSGDRLLREKKTVERMIMLYCQSVHKSKKVLCNECTILVDYARKRIDHCRFGIKKPVCSKCEVHCYKPDMKKRIRIVMKKVGPIMILRHPLLTILHVMDMARYKCNLSK